MNRTRFGLAIAAIATLTGSAAAQQFNGGMPAGWVCTGTCGTLGANGIVTLAPGGGSQYGYVSTYGGNPGTALSGVGGTGTPINGSTLLSTAFAATTGDLLNFNFNYVTSDGASFADYAWARLLDNSLSEVALLFTARTAPSGTIIPGFSMPAPAATLNPPSVPIISSCSISFGTSSCPESQWFPLGPSGGNGGSGDCYDIGCGYTGWVGASYTIGAVGNYYLEFGVTNWDDQFYDSGLAFDGLQINNTPITATPEPASLALLATGLFGVAGFVRRRRGSINA